MRLNEVPVVLGRLAQRIAVGVFGVRVDGDRADGDARGRGAADDLAQNCAQRSGVVARRDRPLADAERKIERAQPKLARGAGVLDHLHFGDFALEQHGVLIVPAHLDQQSLAFARRLGGGALRVVDQDLRLIDQAVVVLDLNPPDIRRNVDPLQKNPAVNALPGHDQNRLSRTTRPGSSAEVIVRTSPGRQSSGNFSGLASAMRHHSSERPK